LVFEKGWEINGLSLSMAHRPANAVFEWAELKKELDAMIRNEETAKSALELMNSAHKLLMDSLKLVEEKCSNEERKEFERRMAHVLWQLFSVLMDPIYREHPSLAPPDTPKEFMDAWRGESPG
jgi:hypothetical protein